MNETHEGGMPNAGMPGGTPRQQQSEGSGKSKNVGPVIGIIIIIIVLILGGFYFWGERLDEAGQLEEAESSDDVSAIESDLEAESDFADLDAEMEALEQELESETAAE